MVPNFVVRVDQDPAPVLSSLRGILAQVDSRAALDGVATMNQIVSNSISGPRLYAVLLGTFAGVAVLLAVIGVYGLVTFTVGRRTHEIGVRMALGADRFAVLRLVLRQSIATTMLGIVLGLAGAAAVTRSLESLLFGLGALDRATYGGVAVLFVSVATLAAFIPARRATRIDPTTALRAE
jgi:putative ABC transport system permease protein